MFNLFGDFYNRALSLGTIYLERAQNCKTILLFLKKLNC